MTNGFDKREIRIFFENSDYPQLTIGSSDFPLVGDIFAHKEYGVFEVVQRGFLRGFKNQPNQFIRLREIEGQVHAPSGNYDYLYED